MEEWSGDDEDICWEVTQDYINDTDFRVAPSCAVPKKSITNIVDNIIILTIITINRYFNK